MLVIVGAGALGSHVLLDLRNLTETIKVVDDDRIEAKNVLAQVHTKMGMGRNKAQAIQQLMLGLFARKIEAVPHRLTSDNADALLKGAKLVVDCTDNFESRALIQDWCQKHDVPCLHGGLAADGQFGRVIWSEDFKPDASAEGAATCEGGEHLPFIAMTSAWLAIAAQRFLADGTKIGFQIWPEGARRV